MPYGVSGFLFVFFLVYPYAFSVISETQMFILSVKPRTKLTAFPRKGIFTYPNRIAYIVVRYVRIAPDFGKLPEFTVAEAICSIR